MIHPLPVLSCKKADWKTRPWKQQTKLCAWVNGLEEHESDLHCKRHLDKLPRQNSLTTCKTSRTSHIVIYIQLSAWDIRSRRDKRYVWVDGKWKRLKISYNNKFTRHYLPAKFVRISNMMRFPQSRSKNIIIGILTLGFLEVVEMEYDEGSEWPITLGRLDVFV